MKKLWGIFLAALMVIGCVGCGNGATGNGDDAAGLATNGDMASETGGEAADESVSYTHLDVYKRQVNGLFVLCEDSFEAIWLSKTSYL